MYLPHTLIFTGLLLNSVQTYIYVHVANDTRNAQVSSSSVQTCTRSVQACTSGGQVVNASWTTLFIDLWSDVHSSGHFQGLVLGVCRLENCLATWVHKSVSKLGTYSSVAVQDKRLRSKKLKLMANLKRQRFFMRAGECSTNNYINSGLTLCL